MEKKEVSQIAMSQQMKAVMTIISACDDMNRYASPHIDLRLDKIDWDPIFKVRWTTSQKTALGWAFALWRDEPRPRFNVFESSSAIDRELQNAILHALMIRWGFGRKSIELFEQQTTILGGVA